MTLISRFLVFKILVTLATRILPRHQSLREEGAVLPYVTWCHSSDELEYFLSFFLSYKPSEVSQLPEYFLLNSSKATLFDLQSNKVFFEKWKAKKEEERKRATELQQHPKSVKRAPSQQQDENGNQTRLEEASKVYEHWLDQIERREAEQDAR